MCGRFENKTLASDIVNLLNKKVRKIKLEEPKSKRFFEDIRPTQKILTVILKEETYTVKQVNWGIKFSEKSPLIFNSRIETIKEKKFWNNLFEKNKCIVPMTGFYEWKTEEKKKTRFRIHLPGIDIFFVPAIFHRDKEENIFASLITTIPNEFIKSIHHRMPVIMALDEAISYLNDDPVENFKRCIPYSDNKIMEIELS